MTTRKCKNCSWKGPAEETKKPMSFCPVCGDWTEETGATTEVASKALDFNKDGEVTTADAKAFVSKVKDAIRGHKKGGR